MAFTQRVTTNYYRTHTEENSYKKFQIAEINLNKHKLKKEKSGVVSNIPVNMFECLLVNFVK